MELNIINGVVALPAGISSISLDFYRCLRAIFTHQQELRETEEIPVRIATLLFIPEVTDMIAKISQHRISDYTLQLEKWFPLQKAKLSLKVFFHLDKQKEESVTNMPTLLRRVIEIIL